MYVDSKKMYSLCFQTLSCLYQVNGRRLLGLNHVNVVEILKDLPQHVRLVCARRNTPLQDTFNSSDMQIPGASPYP